MLKVALLWLILDATLFMALRHTFTWTSPELWFSVMGMAAAWLLIFGAKIAGGKR